MSTNPSKAQYQEWAMRARDLAARAATDTARTLHLAMAEEYDAKALAVTDHEDERVPWGVAKSDA